MEGVVRPERLELSGNTQVDAAGQILVGAQNYRHQIYMSGNLTNNGNVRFTTLAAELYNANPAAGVGYSDVIFDNKLKDQSVICNNTTYFYRIQVSKGTDQTYVLNVDADNNTRFRLMGRNDQQAYSLSNTPNIPNLNALGLLSGTLRFGPNIVIPSLSTDCICCGRRCRPMVRWLFGYHEFNGFVQRAICIWNYPVFIWLPGYPSWKYRD